MASKTQSGQQFSARSMNGIIEIDDGAGTLISGGIIQTNNINTSNLTSNTISANNLLEADVNETITAKWTFSQAPYITTTPTDGNDAVNKSYTDTNFVSKSLAEQISGSKTFTAVNNTFQNITFMDDVRMPTSYNPTLTYQVVDKKYVDNKFVDKTSTQSITGTKTFTLPKVVAGYVPSGTYDLLPKFYVDNNFVDKTTNQSVAGSKTFTDIPYLTNIRDNSLVNGTLQLYYNNTTGEIGKVLSVSPVIDLEYVLQQGNDANGESMTGLSNLTMDTGYSPSTNLQVATKEYVDNQIVGGGNIESVLQAGNNANGESMTGLSNLTMDTGYTPTLDLEVASKNYSDVFTGKIDTTNNSFFTTIELFNPPFQVSGTTTIPVGFYTIQSLLTQIATSLASTFSATIPPSVVITEWTYDITTNKVSAVLPSNSVIPELTHRIEPLLQLLGFQASRSPIPYGDLLLLNNSPATTADHPQHLPYLKDYVDGNFVSKSIAEQISGSKTFTAVNNTFQNITFMDDVRMPVSYNPTLTNQVVDKKYVDNNFIALTGFQTITGQKTFTSRQAFTTTTDMADILMFAGYTPTTALQVATKEYVDNKTIENVLQAGNDANGETITNLSNLTMQSGYTPVNPLDIATKAYADSQGGGGMSWTQLFQNPNPNPALSGGNTHLTNPLYYPFNFYGKDNTHVGRSAGSYITQDDIAKHSNVFLGFDAGYWFGYFTPTGSGSNNTFLGHQTGYDGGGSGYSYNMTTCLGAYSYATKDNQVALGTLTEEVIVRGTFVDEGTMRVDGIATFNAQTNFNSQPYHKIASISYKLLSEFDAYTQTQVNNLLASKASITELQIRTPIYFSTWTYANQNTSFTTLSSWSNGAVAFSHFSPLASNTGNSTFQNGEGVPPATESLTQMSQFGTWTANVSGMYNIECVLSMYPSYQMELWIEIYRTATGSFSTDKYFRQRHQVSIAGSSPYGIPFNYNSLIYLAQGDGIRVRANASGAYTFGYVYTYYQNSYLRITRTTGYS